ncbi:LEA family epithelial adhesin, partial [Limosilactobacillus vaginalis]|uniref:LEA family epithelial adhesin n=1 Tax=Limosilactobacillus vaginalis TaxID=1633 RepID=UPI0025A4CB9A
MNKQRNFEETKRTPHYGLRKLNVGVASVLLGVTVFGINVALDPAKAAANADEPVIQSTEKLNDPTGNVTSTGSSQDATPAGSGQNTDTTGKGQNPASVDENNINTQTQAKNNQLAKETGLTSSDNSSSNIYMGTDGNYYKVVTIYGNDYVYRPVKVYANGTATGQYATNERDTRTNIVTSKEDLGNGKVHWKITFFPAKGLTKYKSTLSGLQSAKFGVALTKDYKIIGDVTVNIDSIADAYHTYTAMTGHGSRGDHEFTPEAHVVQSFNPNTDVDLSGWINSSTMPGENNDYILGPYYFTTENSVGKQNLGNTFFKEATVNNNVYTQEPFVGGVHDLWTDNYTIRNENKNALDGGDYVNKHLIYDPLYNGRYDHTDGFFNSDDFGSAMIFKSHGKTGTAQFASFTISFDTQHTDSYQSELAKGPKDRPQQFSGIIANTYSYQNDYYNMYSISLGEQRSLKKVGAKYVPNEPGDVVSNWKKGQEALTKINQKYLNKAQIDILSNAIHSNIDDEDTVDQIVTIGNKLNDAMKALGNSVGQYDDQRAYTDHVVDTVKQSDRYLNADPMKRSAYDQAVEAAQKVLDKEKGQNAEQPKVEELTKAVNDAWKALNGSTIPTQKVVVADPLKLTPDELEQIKQKVAAVNPGTTVEVAPDGSVTIKRGDQVLTPIAGDQLVIGQTKVDDPKNLTPTEQGEVKQKVSTAYQSLGVTNVTISNDGTATVTLQRTVTLPSESVTIPGTDLVVKKTDAEKYTPKAGKITVDNGTKLEQGTPLTEDQLATAIPNHADLPDGTTYTWKDTVTVGNDTPSATVVVTYPDQTSEEVRVPVEVKGTDSETYEPKLPADKVKVDDKNNLTEDEKTTVKTAVEDANKDKSGKSTLPEGTDITVGDNGDVTVTYTDNSTDLITGDNVVEQKPDNEKYEPKVPGNKVKVDDPNNLTNTEKQDVVKAVEDANKDESGKSTLPEGTKVTVGDNGNVTVTYPDNSTDPITGDKVVEKKSDADKNDPKVPGDKVKVDNPNKLTDDEKSEVTKAVENANKDEHGKSTLPEGTTVTVDDKGNATVTYPDHSTDTIKGSDLVRPATDAEKT